MSKEVKLFVWTDFMKDFTGGIAFAIASNEDEAMKLIEKELEFSIPSHKWGDLEIIELNKPVARASVGCG